MNNTIHLHQLSDHAQAHERDATTPLIDAVLLVPSSGISCIALSGIDIPKRYLQQALPSLLEDKVVEPIDDLHLSTSAHGKTQLDVLVATNHTVQEWLDTALSCGINPSAILPDFYALPLHPQAYSVQVLGDYAVVRCDTHSGFSGSRAEVLALLARSPSLALHCYGELDPDIAALGDIESHPEQLTYTDANAISLRHGKFAGKRRGSNPYRPYYWPLALTATLLLSMSLNFYLQGRYYEAENKLLKTAISDDYQAIFSKPIEPNWQASAQFQTALAQAQLNGHTLENWHLLQQLNRAMARCNNCVIEELSLDPQGARLTLKRSGSEALVSAIATIDQLHLSSQQTMEDNITLSVQWSDA